MTVSRLTMNSMEILSESEQLFITKYNKYFYKVRRFYYKVLQDRGRHANPYRKFNFAVISEKMSFQYRYTQISFPHCRLMIKAISFRSGENVWA